MLPKPVMHEMVGIRVPSADQQVGVTLNSGIENNNFFDVELSYCSFLTVCYQL